MYFLATRRSRKKAKESTVQTEKQKQLDVSSRRFVLLRGLVFSYDTCYWSEFYLWMCFECVIVVVSVRGGAAASSKLKGTATKSGGKVDSRSRDKISKTTGKSEEISESDDMSIDVEPGAARKSKDNAGSMPRSKDKSKVETPKTVTKAKAKTPQGGSTSNGTGKAKSSLSKVKDSGKTPEIAKVKSADASKAGKSRSTGKKRRRGY